jgi:hypothetical protein
MKDRRNVRWSEAMSDEGLIQIRIRIDTAAETDCGLLHNQLTRDDFAARWELWARAREAAIILRAPIEETDKK